MAKLVPMNIALAQRLGFPGASQPQAEMPGVYDETMLADLDAQQALARRLMDSAGSGPVRTPMEGIGRLAKTLTGAWMEKKSSEKKAGIQKQRSDGLSQALSDALKFQPADYQMTPRVGSVGSGDSVESRAAQGAYDQPDEQSMLAKMLSSDNPDLRGMAAPMAVQQQFQTDTKRQEARAAAEAKLNEPYTLGEGQTRFGAGGQAIAHGAEKPKAAPTTRNRVDGDKTIVEEWGDGGWNKVSEGPRGQGRAGQGAGGAFAGNGLDAQLLNMLIKGDPSSPEYAAAYARMSQPKMQYDQTSGAIIPIRPDMAWARPPAQQGAPQPQQAPQVGPVSQQPGMPTVGAPIQVTEPKVNDAQNLSAGYAQRMMEAEDIFSQPAVGDAAKNYWQNARAGVPYVGNYLTSPEYQKFDQAKRNFTTANLRKESGALIGPEEFSNANTQYLPQPGDSPEVLEQKKKNRATVIGAMKQNAGKAFKEKPGASQVIRYDAQGNRIP